MDLTWSAGRGGVPRRGRALARGQRAPHGAAVGRHRARASPRHLEWERTLFDARWAVVSWPEEYGGRDASPVGVADLRGGVLPGRRARSGSRRTASSCSRRRIFEFGTPEQQDRILPRMARGERPVVPGLVRAQRRQRPRRHPSRRVRDEAAGGWRLTARRRGRRAARSARTCSACSAPTPTAERHRGLTYFLVAARRRRRDRARASAGSTATRASPRCSSTTCSCPTPTCSASVDQGWAVAMATTGSERGLTLRSPGRFLATADRLIDLVPRARRRRRRDPARPASSTAWIDAEAYRWQTLCDRDRLRRGRRAGRGVEPRQGLLVASSTSRCTRSRSTCSARDAELDDDAVDEGLRSSRSSGPIYAGTNEIQRNVIAERVLGLPRSSDEVRVHRRPARVPRRGARPAREGVPARGRARRVDERRRAASPGVWDALAEMGVLGVLVPEADGGLGLDEVDLVLVARGDRPRRAARADRRDGRGRRAAARPRRRCDGRRRWPTAPLVPWADTRRRRCSSTATAAVGRRATRRCSTPSTPSVDGAAPAVRA